MIDRRCLNAAGIAGVLLLGAASNADKAAGAAPAAVDSKTAITPGLWRMTVTTSLRPEPAVRQLCVSANGLQPHYSTQGVNCKTTRTLGPGGSIVGTDACTMTFGQETDVSHGRTEMSADGRHIHTREDQTEEGGPAGFPKQSWFETTGEYLGACPIPMRPEPAVRAPP